MKSNRRIIVTKYGKVIVEYLDLQKESVCDGEQMITHTHISRVCVCGERASIKEVKNISKYRTYSQVTSISPNEKLICNKIITRDANRQEI